MMARRRRPASFSLFEYLIIVVLISSSFFAHSQSTHAPSRPTALSFPSIAPIPVCARGCAINATLSDPCASTDDACLCAYSTSNQQKGLPCLQRECDLHDVQGESHHLLCRASKREGKGNQRQRRKAGSRENIEKDTENGRRES